MEELELSKNEGEINRRRGLKLSIEGRDWSFKVPQEGDWRY
jgi:hypothetical protein